MRDKTCILHTHTGTKPGRQQGLLEKTPLGTPLHASVIKVTSAPVNPMTTQPGTEKIKHEQHPSHTSGAPRLGYELGTVSLPSLCQWFGK